MSDPQFDIERREEDIAAIKTSQIWQTSIQWLNEFYKPYNKLLANLLGDDKFLWQDSPTQRILVA